ncbi:MAG: hypothetical protein WCB51_02240, partial [Candidatus Dormiibacterota bacterium]
LLTLTAGAVVVLLGSLAISGPQNAAGLISAPTYAHLDLQSNSIPTLLARPLGSNAAAWIAALALACVAVGGMALTRARLRQHPVPAVAVGIGLSVLLSPHLGDYSLMLLAVPVAVLVPRAQMLVLGLAAAYTLASLWNPLEGIHESTVALVLLAGVVTISWQALQLGPKAPAMRRFARATATGVRSG